VCVCVCVNERTQMNEFAVQECLLHLAVESEDAEIFDLILTYGERRSRPWILADEKMKYPWPEQKFNNSTVWKVRFIPNSIRV